MTWAGGGGVAAGVDGSGRLLVEQPDGEVVCSTPAKSTSRASRRPSRRRRRPRRRTCAYPGFLFAGGLLVAGILLAAGFALRHASHSSSPASSSAPLDVAASASTDSTSSEPRRRRTPAWSRSFVRSLLTRSSRPGTALALPSPPPSSSAASRTAAAAAASSIGSRQRLLRRPAAAVRSRLVVGDRHSAVLVLRQRTVGDRGRHDLRRSGLHARARARTLAPAAAALAPSGSCAAARGPARRACATCACGRR